MKKHRDHIFPRAEGGPDDDWNIREIDADENLKKGAEMPDISDVLDSSDPIRLAAEIDKRSLEGPFRSSRNKNKGFGGLTRS